MGNRRIKNLLFTIAFIFLTQNVFAVCDTTFVNPLTDIEWSGVFPIRLMGAIISPSGPEENHIIRSPFCACDDGGRKRVGVLAGFWEPVRLIDVVKDPFCMAGMGFSLNSNSKKVWGSGGKASLLMGKSQGQGAFFQAHLYIYPVWAILELFADYMCAEKGTFDIAYMTELDPLWDDDLLTAMLNPEAILFGNPVAQFTCIADAVASTLGWSLQPLFWCAGSWGGAYPLTGRTDNRSLTEGAAHVGGKLIYKLHRELIMMGTSGETALCGPFFAPVWIKDQYKMQLVRPVKSSNVFVIGRSSLVWGGGKNPPIPGKSDNYSFVLFRNRDCCAY